MEDGEKRMKTKIGIDGPYTQAGVTIIPVFQSRSTVFPGGATGEKVPLGLLMHAGTHLSIISFIGSYAWWDELVSAHPALQTLHPVFPEKSPERPKK
jgi:hypothetical protein